MVKKRILAKFLNNISEIWPKSALLCAFEAVKADFLRKIEVRLFNPFKIVGSCHSAEKERERERERNFRPAREDY